jgi:hypothetical protein
MGLAFARDARTTAREDGGMAMTDRVECEIFIAMNEDGGWVVTNEEREALSDLEEVEGGYRARVIKIIVRMAPPLAMTEAVVDIPDEVGQTHKIEATA